ncbi:MAG: hypothetical protein Q4B48_08885 [Syntrophomonadaceae bacterium]|nr:hypothetical protein [Syntrophomonadaceae bacterium]
MDDIDKILARLVQVGTVTVVDNDKHLARVKFQDTGLVSGWLHVLDNRSFIPDYDVGQRTENRGGGSGDPAFESHNHDLIIKQWMPKVNATVVVLYLPIFNGDGFVIGGIS